MSLPFMPNRLITPSQLSLFSISPVIGAWWEDLQAQKLFEGSKPAVRPPMLATGHYHAGGSKMEFSFIRVRQHEPRD